MWKIKATICRNLDMIMSGSTSNFKLEVTKLTSMKITITIYGIWSSMNVSLNSTASTTSSWKHLLYVDDSVGNESCYVEVETT